METKEIALTDMENSRNELPPPFPSIRSVRPSPSGYLIVKVNYELLYAHSGVIIHENDEF